MKKTPLKRGKAKSFNSTLKAQTPKTADRNARWRDIVLWRMNYLIEKYGFLICEYCGKKGSADSQDFLGMWGHHIDGDRNNCTLGNCYIVHNTCHQYITDNNIIVSQEDWKTREKLEEVLSTDFKPKSIFWDTFFIRMTDEDLILNLEDPEYELKYMFLKNHKDVKSSPSEMKAGARWVMNDIDEEAKKYNIASRVKRKSFAEIDKMSVQDMRDALRLYGERSEDMDPELVESKLTEYIERRPDKFKEIWIDNKSRKTQVLIERATQKGIIRKASMRYLFGTQDMGTGIHAAIAWLDDIEHQDVKLTILQQLK